MSSETDQKAPETSLPSQKWTWASVVDDFERAEGASLSPADRIRLLALRKTAAELDADYQKSLATTLLNTLDRMTAPRAVAPASPVGPQGPSIFEHFGGRWTADA